VLTLRFEEERGELKAQILILAPDILLAIARLYVLFFHCDWTIDLGRNK
jgi:hypothetical protein